MAGAGRASCGTGPPCLDLVVTHGIDHRRGSGRRPRTGSPGRHSRLGVDRSGGRRRSGRRRTALSPDRILTGFVPRHVVPILHALGFEKCGVHAASELHAAIVSLRLRERPAVRARFAGENPREGGLVIVIEPTPCEILRIRAFTLRLGNVARAGERNLVDDVEVTAASTVELVGPPPILLPVPYETRPDQRSLEFRSDLHGTFQGRRLRRISIRANRRLRGLRRRSSPTSRRCPRSSRSRRG